MKETKIVLLTHGGWGMTLVESLKMILGEVHCCHEVPLLPAYTLQDYLKIVEEYVETISQDSIFLTDLYGGTTTKVAMMVGYKRGMRVFCGLSAPVLLEACSQLQFQGAFQFDVLIEAGETSFKDVIKELKEKKGV